MDGYEKRTKLKKKSIIDAAWELFSVRGIGDVSISEIAKNANVSQVSIYNYFGSKNELAKEVLMSYISKAITNYDEILEKEIPFNEKLEQIINIKHEDKILQSIYKDALDSNAKTVYLKFIELGKEEGVIDKSIPTDALVDFLLSSVSIMEQKDYLNTSPEYKNGIIKLFFYGILGK